ncbi:MAG TPA: CocE/NonD family hydrolase [Mycobacteriales bacterium]|nr:CocE/NonD family hydrolase [Mycobacteriales bacterium]
MGGRARLACSFLLAVAGLTNASASTSSPDAGRSFDPKPVSKPIYGILGPRDAGARPDQEHVIKGPGDVDILIDTWLPKANGRHVPPTRVPVVMHMTPYEQKGYVYPELAEYRWLNALVPRGFAYSRVYLRGTGGSGGCMDHLGDDTVEDLTRAVEWLGRDASWTTGAVGSIGLSHHGGSQIALASRGDPRRTRYLKAMVVGAPYSSVYSARTWDGVPIVLAEAVTQVAHSQYGVSPGYDPTSISDLDSLQEYLDNRTRPGGVPEPQHLAQRAPCRAEGAPAAADPSGDFTPYFAERESRRWAHRIRAATLMVQGLHDLNIHSHNQVGLFDRIPDSTPHAGIFGWWEHAWPDQHRFRSEWRRANFMDGIVAAWFDRWLKGAPTGAERWPRAQVQDSTGQWRAEPNWPFTGAAAGQLALSQNGALGVADPGGSSTYTEGLLETEQTGIPEGQSVSWQTAPLPGLLHIAGPLVLDAHVVLDRPDAHLVARLELLDANGKPLPESEGASGPTTDGGALMAMRSMRHLDPMPRGYFEQAEGRPAPVGQPIRVSVRFDPTDLIVPAGGRIRLTLAGTMSWGPGVGEGAIGQPTLPSFSFTRVTVLHDCAYPSALRFLLRRNHPRYLNVREHDEPVGKPLSSRPPPKSPRPDANGLATAPVCGRTPTLIEDLRSRDG